MSLPKPHLESLERHLRIHDEQLEALHASRQAFTGEIERREHLDQSREPPAKPGGIPVLVSQREVIERKIQVHETLAALGRDQRSIDALAELIGNPELARAAARDPRAFARERGIEFPTNIVVEIIVDGDQVKLRVTHYDDLAPFTIAWDDAGFSSPPPDPSQARQPAAESEPARKTPDEG
jgi:hypothetical protein